MSNKSIFGSINSRGVVTKHLEIDLNNIPSKDPIAFAFGLSRAIQQRKKEDEKRILDRKDTFEEIHGSKYRELSQEYLRGYKLGYVGILLPEGTKIRKGTESNYFDYHLNILKKSE